MIYTIWNEYFSTYEQFFPTIHQLNMELHGEIIVLILFYRHKKDKTTCMENEFPLHEGTFTI